MVAGSAFTYKVNSHYAHTHAAHQCSWASSWRCVGGKHLSHSLYLDVSLRTWELSYMPNLSSLVPMFQSWWALSRWRYWCEYVLYLIWYVWRCQRRHWKRVEGVCLWMLGSWRLYWWCCRILWKRKTMSSLRNLDHAQVLSFPCSCAASSKCFLLGIKACYNYTLGNIEIVYWRYGQLTGSG